jgi:mono/diheme cytochrome c family protein
MNAFRARLIPFLLLALVLVLPVCVMAQEDTPPQNQEAQEATAPPPPPLVIPEAEKNRKNPSKITRSSVDLGRKLFSSQCAMCHGAKGDGQGDLAVELTFKMPNFTQPEKRTDGELYYIITHGHVDMPEQGDRLRPKQKWDMINFIRSLTSQKSAKRDKPKE